MNHRYPGGTGRAAVTLRPRSSRRALVALVTLVLLVIGSPVGAQEAPGADPQGPGPSPTTTPETDLPFGTQEPLGGDPLGSDPATLPGADVPVDAGAPLVDPVDSSLVDQVLASTSRLAELDTAIALTLQQIVEADAAIAVLTEEAADTRESVAVTEEAIDEREADIADTRARIADLEDQLRRRIVDAYVAGSGAGADWIGSTNVDELDRRATRRAISESQAASDDEAAGELRDERRRLDRQREQLEDQGDRLDRHQANVATLQADVTTARAERADLLTSLAQDSLGVAMTFVADQLALLDAVGVDGTTGLPPAGFALDGQPLCDAAGIIVACSIAPEIAFMLAAAREDGVVLTGGGWRSTASQIALRIANCGGDAFGAPASSCSPPTARPGSSQHEFGLAIDFADCASRTTRCHQWLAQHAQAYGLANLPSEPWHWSTTGS